MHPVLEEIQALRKSRTPTQLLRHPRSRNRDNPARKPWEQGVSLGLGEWLSFMYEEKRENF